MEFVYKVRFLRCCSKSKSSNTQVFCGLDFSHALNSNFLAQTLDFMSKQLISVRLIKSGIFEIFGESDSECSSSMFRSSENKEFTFVNDCFQNKKKEEIGHYERTLTYRFFSNPVRSLNSLINSSHLSV